MQCYGGSYYGFSLKGKVFGQCYFAFTVTSLYYQLLVSTYQHSFK